MLNVYNIKVTELEMLNDRGYDLSTTESSIIQGNYTEKQVVKMLRKGTLKFNGTYFKNTKSLYSIYIFDALLDELTVFFENIGKFDEGIIISSANTIKLLSKKDIFESIDSSLHYVFIDKELDLIKTNYTSPKGWKSDSNYNKIPLDVYGKMVKKKLKDDTIKFNIIRRVDIETYEWIVEDEITLYNDGKIKTFKVSINVQIFKDEDLQTNVTKHVMVPKYELVENYNDVKKMQILKKYDPVVMYYNWPRGSIIKSTREDITMLSGDAIEFNIVK